MAFKRHFRIYFKNNHPAYIVDEEGNEYIFHRVTHSKTSGGKKNWKRYPNPLANSNKPMYIVKKELSDKKNRFSPYKLEAKDYVDIQYPDIKKAGSTQTTSRATNATSKNIKKQNRTKVNKKHENKKSHNKT